MMESQMLWEREKRGKEKRKQVDEKCEADKPKPLIPKADGVPVSGNHWLGSSFPPPYAYQQKKNKKKRMILHQSHLKNREILSTHFKYSLHK